MEKTRDRQFNNYQLEALASVADSKTALIVGFLAGLSVFASLIVIYLILLLLMAIMGTLLSLPTLKEVALRSGAVVGFSGDVFPMLQGMLSLAMLLSLLGAFTGSLNSKNKAISFWNIKFGKDVLPYFFLVLFLIGAYFVSLLPQTTLTIITMSDNTGSVPLWGIIILTIGISIVPTILLYEFWWHWYKKVMPFWLKDEETLKKAKEKADEIANN